VAGKKKLSPRAERRLRERDAEKIARARERLAYLEVGGDSARPVEVESASQVEPHALALSCLRCDGPYRLEEHAAVTVFVRSGLRPSGAGDRLRVARLSCPRCGARREVWFRLAPRLPS
jgi:hypothetical protein